MPQQRVYYEYVNAKLIPYWYVLTFKPCEIKWDKPVLYFDVIPPFEFIERDEFDESINSVSIFLSDLIINDSYPNKLGIYLKRLKERIKQYGVDPYVVQQFIMQVPDVDEVLNLMPNKRKMSFIMER